MVGPSRRSSSRNGFTTTEAPPARPTESRRRRAASLVVLAVAALASLGTSASPLPRPALTDTLTGTIEVTADNPVATVDVSVTVNAAMRAAPTNSTEVAIGANIRGGGPDASNATTLVTVEALDGVPETTTDAFPSLRSLLDDACGAGDCTGRYRITVVLTDPEADRASFDWSASASSRFGPAGATGSPPPDSRLEVTAEPAVLVPAARLTRTIVTPEPVRVDASHPRTSVTYEFTRGADAPTSGESPKLVVRLEADDSEPTAMDRPAMLTVRSGDREVASTYLWGVLQLVPITLPATCDDPIGCTEPLTFQFDWQGGDPANGIDQAWSVTGVAIAARDEPPAAVAFGAESRIVLAIDDPHLTATTSGSFDIGRDKVTFLDATMTLDASALGQGQGGVQGFVQGKLTATSTAHESTARTQVRILVDERSVAGQPGEPLAVVGRLVTLECEGRSRCTADFPFGASMGSDDPVDAHVVWTLTIVFLPDPPGSIPPEVELLLETSPRPNP